MSETLQARLASLFEVAGMLASVKEIDSLLEGIISHVQVVMKCGAASVYLRVPGSDWLEVVGSRGKVADKIRRTKLRFGEGIGGEVARTRQVINVADAYEDNRFSPSFDKATGFRTKQLLSMPMIFGDSVVGVITVINHLEDRKFDAEDERVLQMFCIQAAIAVYHAQERDRQEQRVRATAGFSRDVTDILAREVTVIYGCLHQLERILQKMLPPEALAVADKLHTVVASMDTSVESIRRLATTLQGVIHAIEPAPAEEFSWEGFLQEFFKHSRFHQNRVFVKCRPGLAVYTAKQNLAFVVEALLQLVSPRAEESSRRVMHADEVSLVLRERSDTIDFCVCFSSSKPLSTNCVETVHSRDGLSLVAIQSAAAMLNGELIGFETLSSHNLHELPLAGFDWIVPDSSKEHGFAAKETAEPDDSALVLWQLSIPLVVQ